MSSASTSRYTISPKSGKKILIRGPTYLKLAKDPKYADLLRPRPTKAERFFPKRSASGSKSRGCSNQRKYINSGIPESQFCGPAGGACPYTYPVNTRKRARAALSYARHAPNPEGIKECARRIAKERGWMQDGKIKMVKIRGVPHGIVKDRQGKSVLVRI